MNKRSYQEPIVLCKENDLVVTTETNLKQYLDKGFRIISEEEIEDIGRSIDIKLRNPIYVYDKEEDILMVATENYLIGYINMGFKIVSEEEAKSMSQFKNIKNLVE